MNSISKYLLSLKEKFGNHRKAAKEVGIPAMTFFYNMKEQVVISNKTLTKILTYSKGEIDAGKVLKEIADLRSKSNSKPIKNKESVRNS